VPEQPKNDDLTEGADPAPLKEKGLDEVQPKDLDVDVEGDPDVGDLIGHLLDSTLEDEEFRREAADVIDEAVDAGPLEAYDGQAIRVVLRAAASMIPDAV